MHAPSHPKELSPSDQTLLVLLAQAGDRAALEQLLRNSHAPLRRYITRLAGADLADDILQETSIQIFRKLPFLREPAVFQAWALRIASRIAISHPQTRPPLATPRRLSTRDLHSQSRPWRATRCHLLLSSRPRLARQPSSPPSSLPARSFARGNRSYSRHSCRHRQVTPPLRSCDTS